MSWQVTAKSFMQLRLFCAFALFVIVCTVGLVTPAAAQTIAPPNTVFKAGSVYGLASGTSNIGSGNLAGGYFGNGGGTVFDVAITNGTGSGNQLFIFQSNGDGSFSLPSSGIYNFGTAVHDGLNLIVAGPVVSPASKDLVVTDDAGALYLMRGIGDGTFQSPVSLGQTASTLSSYLNSSGTLNLVTSYLTFPTTTTTQSVVKVLTNANDGTGTFTAQSVPIPVNLSVNQASPLSAGGATALFIVYAGGTAALSQSVSGTFQAPVSLGNNGTPSGMGAGAISSFTSKGNTYFAGIATFGTGPAVYVWTVTGGTGGIVLGSSPSVYSIPTNDAVYVTTADLDGDGNPDLIVLGGGQFSTKQTVNLFLSGSANGFAPPQILGSPNEILGPGVYGIQALAADANGDGKLDLFAYEPSQGLTVLLNQGSGAYLTPTTLAAGNTPKSVAKGDFNGDGIDDLVVANGLNSATNTSDNTVSVFVSKAAGSFAPQVTYPVGTHPLAVTAGTVNTHLSIFAISAADTTGNFSNPVVTFLQGNGDGTFQTPVYFPTGSNVSLGAQPLAIATGIFDASGNSTVAVANSDGTINLFTYNSGAFVETSTLNAAGAPAFGLSISSLAVGDMNGDGNMDIVATLRAQCGYNLITGLSTLSGGAVLIFAGNGAGVFQPPVSITSTAASSDPASVALGNIVNTTRTDMLVIDARGSGASCASSGAILEPNPILFTNSGNLTFTESDLPVQFDGVASNSGTLPLAAIADVNGDGLNDLVFSQNGLVSALLQGGTGTLLSTPTIYVGSSSSASLVTGSFFAPGGHDAALASSAGVALIQSSFTPVVPPPPVTVVITPSPASVPAGQTVQFSDVVTGTTNTNVIWSVQAGGAGGTISGSGLYTAPATTGVDTVIATSVASPTSSASVTVTVTAPLPRPGITSVSPSSGPASGGETVIITGQNFQTGATVFFANTPATSVTFVSATSLSVVVPALVAAGPDDVKVINPDGQSALLAGGFLAVPRPGITSVSPSSGPASGGETVIITGQNFQTGATVFFANTPATSVTFVSATSLSVVVPALVAAGPDDVKVINPDGQSALLAGGFLAVPRPGITSVSPSSGPASGGETVIITGQNFQTGATVFFANTPATSVTFVSATSLSVVVPALVAAGPDDVKVINPDGQSALLAGAFIVVGAPPPPITITVSETITLTDTLTVPPAITLTGIVAPVAYYSAGSVGFVGVAPGLTVTQSLTLSNIGLQPLGISEQAITQDLSNSFSVTQVQCTDGRISIPDTLPSGGSCTLTISYTAPASGTPSGTITFTDNAGLSNLASTASGSSFTQTLVLSSTASTTSAPPPPPTTITIPITETITVNDQVGANVNTPTTTTSVAPSVNPAIFNQPVNLMATINSGAGTATGTVTFYDGSAIIGTATLVNGIGSLPVAFTSVGLHSITASYGGDSGHTASTSVAVVVTVNQASTTTVVTSSQNPQRTGQSITFTATVTSQFGGVATGSVIFKTGATTLGTVALSGNRATLTTSFPAPGTYFLTAQYTGDANNIGSTAPTFSESVVVRYATTIKLTSTPNPSLYGQSVTFTATVGSASPSRATGLVLFTNGTTTLGLVSLSGGVATLTSANLPSGTLSITATYIGSLVFAGSTSAPLTQVVGEATTTTTVVSSRNPSTFGQSVRFTATVRSATVTPTGTVTFRFGATVLGRVAVAGGTASVAVSNLPRGADTITATYTSGSPNILGSSGTVVQQVD